MQHILSVSELSMLVQNKLQGIAVKVRGEISNLSLPSSGHAYFTIKDDKAVLQAIAWRSTKLSINLENGINVICEGHITTYPGRSQYQLLIDRVSYDGLGALMQLFEKRKLVLASEGLFAQERKRAIPTLPETIGIVTSPSGAVIEDIISRISARFPCKLVIASAIMQGKAAELSIIAAIEGLNRRSDIDVIILARGGGSLEDLWAFNEERLVRTVAASTIPIVSAIGHETDVTLTDYAADLRAPTPTAAAELVTPTVPELNARLVSTWRHIFSLLSRMKDAHLNSMLAVFGRIKFAKCYPSMDGAVALWNQSKAGLRIVALTTSQRLYSCRLSPPALLTFHERLENLMRLIDNCHYQNVLSRGFAIVRSEGKIISKTNQVRKGAMIDIQFSDGSCLARVVEQD